MVLAIDIGNSRVKAGYFESGQLRTLKIYSHEELKAGLLQDFDPGKKDYPLKYIAWISVGEEAFSELAPFFQKHWPEAERFAIDRNTNLPVANEYETPETLGIDRIVAVCGAKLSQPSDPVLVIDAGTAITYDFADEGGLYHGGGIAPGIRLRFEVLHEKTARLPLVEIKNQFPLIGKTTEESILSGVLNGILAEIEGIIERYKGTAGNSLKVYLTGGDTEFLGNHLKNINFADSELVLKGIYTIVSHNYSNV